MLTTLLLPAPTFAAKVINEVKKNDTITAKGNAANIFPAENGPRNMGKLPTETNISRNNIQFQPTKSIIDTTNTLQRNLQMIQKAKTTKSKAKAVNITKGKKGTKKAK